MTLPECVMRLLPDDLPLDAVTVKFRSPVTVKGIHLDPIFRSTSDEVAICNTEQQILPSLQMPRTGERVWYSIDRIDAALKLARRLGIDRIFFTQAEQKGEPIALLALIGRDSRTALVVAPNLTGERDCEEEDKRGRDI